MGLVKNKAPSGRAGPSTYQDYLAAASFHMYAAIGEMGRLEVGESKDRKWLKSVHKRLTVIVNKKER